MPGFLEVCIGAGTDKGLAEPLQWVTLIPRIPANAVRGTLSSASVHWPWPSRPSPGEALLVYDLHGKAPASPRGAERESLKSLNKLDAKSKHKHKEGGGRPCSPLHIYIIPGRQ